VARKFALTPALSLRERENLCHFAIDGQQISTASKGLN